MDIRVPELEILLLQRETADRLDYHSQSQEIVISSPAGSDPLLTLEVDTPGTYTVRPDYLKIRMSKQFFDWMAGVIRDSG